MPPTGLASRRISAVASHRPRLTPHSDSLTGPGYLKPVGQQHVEVQAAAEGAPPLRVDKDCRLAKEYFGLRCEYKHMSPVLMPRGFTKSYVDGEIDMERQKQALLHAWEALRAAHPNVVVEGTGHMGVGSIVGLDNAAVAKLLGLEVVLVCEGGLGSAFDELSLNLAVCAAQGVKVLGSISFHLAQPATPSAAPLRTGALRGAQPRAAGEGRDDARLPRARAGADRRAAGRARPDGSLLRSAVEGLWTAPLHTARREQEPFLAAPSMGDFAKLLGQRLISGEGHGGSAFVAWSSSL